MVILPTLHPARDSHRGVLVWRFDAPRAALSSAAVGGGRATVRWVLNLGVHKDYGRTDLEVHATELAAEQGLDGDGITLFTAADITARRRAEIEGVAVDATVGITTPTWAAAPDELAPHEDLLGAGVPPAPGTINLVVQLPVVLDEGAAVNAVMIATEAKTQALLEHGVAGTGTASDAVVIVWPAASAVGSTAVPAARFAGPRSPWGARLAIAVHTAVRAGLGPSR